MDEGIPKENNGANEVEPASETIGLGHFEVYNNFQFGVELSCSLEGDAFASVSLLPSEALALADLIEQHRNELEAARDTEKAVVGLAPVSVTEPSAGPDPIPAVQNLRGDLTPE